MQKTAAWALLAFHDHCLQLDLPEESIITTPYLYMQNLKSLSDNQEAAIFGPNSQEIRELVEVYTRNTTDEFIKSLQRNVGGGNGYEVCKILEEISRLRKLRCA